MMSLSYQSNTEGAEDKLTYPWRKLGIAFAVMMFIALLAAGVGAVNIHPLIILKILMSKLPFVHIEPNWQHTYETILLQIRIPRVSLSCLVGGTLAISGAAYQGLFRNPLADPYLIGAAPGAGLGATIVLATSVPTFFQGINILPLAAFVGAIGAVSIAYFTARNSDGLPLATLILAGVAIASLTTSLSAFILIRSDPDVRPVLSWLMGGFIHAQWKHSIMILPYLITTVIVMLVHGRLLNVMQLGEDHARQLGVSVENIKLLLIISATLSTAAVVAFSGLIGFVGLIVPHSVRLVWGVDYRFILPMSAISGAAFVTLADLVARTIINPIELPVGIVTAFCGAPFFVYLLRYRRYVAM